MQNQEQTQIYTCPMHPEIQQDKPGRCPKCGMALVIKGSEAPHHVDDAGLGKVTWKSYIPLIVVFVMLLATSSIISWNTYRITCSVSVKDFITYFMTGFFLVFAGFKLMDLKGFAEGYSTYDLLAQKVFGYGYIYPFIELAFGLSMLAGFHQTWLLWTEVVVMVFSGVGVALKLARHEQFQCACLGTFLKVPLTYITLIEDFGMAILALLLLYLK